jgi:hypothetical protein
VFHGGVRAAPFHAPHEIEGVRATALGYKKTGGSPMPFMLYDVASSQGSKQYTSARTVEIAGKAGPPAVIHRSRNPSRSVVWLLGSV